jgi:hypothetical protein
VTRKPPPPPLDTQTLRRLAEHQQPTFAYGVSDYRDWRVALCKALKDAADEIDRLRGGAPVPTTYQQEVLL